MLIRRSQKKRNAEPAQKQNHRRLVIDPMVNPGSSAHRHQARPKADPTRPHHRMVTLAQSSPGDRPALAHQSKTTTVMLGVASRSLANTDRVVIGPSLAFAFPNAYPCARNQTPAQRFDSMLSACRCAPSWSGRCFDRGLPLIEILFGLRQAGDVVAGIAQSHDLAPTRQQDRIERASPDGNSLQTRDQLSAFRNVLNVQFAFSSAGRGAGDLWADCSAFLSCSRSWFNSEI